jgi:hypothetical protein
LGSFCQPAPRDRQQIDIKVIGSGVIEPSKWDHADAQLAKWENGPFGE